MKKNLFQIHRNTSFFFLRFFRIDNFSFHLGITLYRNHFTTRHIHFTGRFNIHLRFKGTGCFHIYRSLFRRINRNRNCIISRVNHQRGRHISYCFSKPEGILFPHRRLIVSAITSYYNRNTVIRISSYYHCRPLLIFFWRKLYIRQHFVCDIYIPKENTAISHNRNTSGTKTSLYI